MKSQEEFDKLFENFSTGVIFHDAQTRVIYANSSALNLIGLTIEQLRAKNLSDPYWRFLREDGTPMPIEETPVMQILMSGKTIKNFIVGIIRPELDHPIWVMSNTHVELDQDGNVYQIIANFTDITEQRGASLKIKAEIERANQYLNIIEVILVAINEEGNITLINRKGCQTLGYSPRELIGKNWFKKCLPAELYEEVNAVHKKIFSGEVAPFEYFENNILTKTGKRRLIAWHNTNLKDENGKIIASLSSGEDITQRRQEEKKLKELTQQLKDTYALAHIGVWSWEVAADKVTWSEELYQIAGLDPNLPPPPFAKMALMHSPESWVRLKAAVENALQIGAPYHLELEYIRPDGTRRNVNVFGGVKRDDNEKITELYGTVQDITEKKRSERDLQIALDSAKAAATIKSRFLDIAAHELRTPVSSFSLLLQLTHKKLLKGTPVDGTILERLQKQTDRISQLVVELLDVSRLERGFLTLKLEETDIVALIMNCLDDFRLRVSTRALNFSKLDGPIIIKIDSLRINQVLTNLLDNAIKYSKENSPIEVSVESTPEFVRVYVKDQGAGISEKQQGELFAAFTRGKNELTEKSSGLGLGLFISREIIALHGGNIGVTSTMDSGSTFHFEIPRGNKTI